MIFLTSKLFHAHEVSLLQQYHFHFTIFWYETFSVWNRIQHGYANHTDALVFFYFLATVYCCLCHWLTYFLYTIIYPFLSLPSCCCGSGPLISPLLYPAPFNSATRIFQSIFILILILFQYRFICLLNSESIKKSEQYISTESSCICWLRRMHHSVGSYVYKN